jgi:hypothetical protein
MIKITGSAVTTKIFSFQKFPGAGYLVTRDNSRNATIPV